MICQRRNILRLSRRLPDVTKRHGIPLKTDRHFLERCRINMHTRRQAGLMVAVADRIGITAIQLDLLGQFDLDDLQDAPPAVVSPEQRLLEAFPGAEEVSS